MAQVLIAGSVNEGGLALLRARGDVDFEMLANPSVADLDARIADIDALVLRLTPVREETIAKADRLKVVSRFGVGYDNVDVTALTRRGIPLTVVGDANAVTVAEHTFMHMLAASRRLIAQDRAVREDRYHERGAAGKSDLWRKTVLVVGFGRIGRLVAERCAAFGMAVIVADPYAERAAVEANGYRYLEDFHDGLAEADFVTLHLPAMADGRPILAAAEFRAMKPGAFLLNVARGALVDEAALAEALESGQLRGAGLDVTREEPPSADSPLLRFDNVVLTPHSASLTEECIERMSIVSVQNALDAIDGCLKPEFVVNREALG